MEDGGGAVVSTNLDLAKKRQIWVALGAIAAPPLMSFTLQQENDNLEYTKFIVKKYVFLASYPEKRSCTWIL